MENHDIFQIKYSTIWGEKHFVDVAICYLDNKVLLNLISCVLIDDYFESKYWDFF